MKLHFLGTGAAEGIPAVFCDCDTCREIRKRGEKEFHTRSQILIDGDLSLDFPPDAYYHSLRFGADFSKLRYVLVTHSHMDHFYAHDFILRGYKYCYGFAEGKLQILGNAEVKKVFEECTRRELRDDVATNLEVVELAPFAPYSFGEYTVLPLKAQHSKVETAFVYLLEKGDQCYLHLTDTGRLPEESWACLTDYLHSKNKKIGLVTFDCTFLFREAGAVSRHMGLPDNAATRDELIARGLVNEATMYAITHYSHNNLPFSETLARAEKEFGVIAAKDGMILEF
jgi:phosphoribosyl 1,2-cyclic phosphate phosphodiesterase